MGSGSYVNPWQQQQQGLCSFCQEQGEASDTEPAAGLGSGMALKHQYGNSWEKMGKGAWVSS